MTKISIVTTMYYSSAFIEEFYNLCIEAINKLEFSYEFIFVNDGSPDDSLIIVKNLLENDKNIKVVDLSRNFGHHRAIMVGLEYATGSQIFLIDCDLEESPLELVNFYSELEKTNSDVVFGVQNNRKGSFVKKLGGAFFWKFFNFVSDTNVDPRVITSRLMTRRYVDALLKFKEKKIFLAGIFALTGFIQVPLLVEKSTRKETTYTIKKRMALLVNAVTSFSSRPLVFVFYVGLIISIISGLIAVLLIIKKLFIVEYQLGWPSIVVSIWLIGGITIFCIGLIGIYLAKVFQEVKDRPLSIVKNIYQKKS